MTGDLLEFVDRRFGRAAGRREPVTMSTPLFSTRLVDSLGVVELLAFIEQRFGVVLTVTMDELLRLDTVQQLSAYVAEQRTAREAREA